MADALAPAKCSAPSGNPPDTYNRAVYFSTMDKIPSFANSAAITPIAPDGTVGDQKVQGNYNGSFMVQQKVGFGTVLEDDLEAELLGQAGDGHDVVGAMRMEMDGPLAIEHFDIALLVDQEVLDRLKWRFEEDAAERFWLVELAHEAVKMSLELDLFGARA